MDGTRICVKNIGKSTKEVQLREGFSKCGEVTDVKVMRKKDGSSRNFAFIGFSRPEQATSAISMFNHTFIGLAKLSIEFAKKRDEVEKAKEQITQKQPSAISKPPVTTVEKPVEKKLSKKQQKFYELLHGTPAAAAEPIPVPEEEEGHIHVPEAVHMEEDTMSVDSFVDLEDIHPSKSSSAMPIRHFQPTAAVAGMSDLDYLRSKVKSTNKNQPDAESNTKDASSDDDSLPRAAEEAATTATQEEQHASAAALDTTRLYITNLPYTCTEDELRSWSGAIEVHLPLTTTSAASNSSKGKGYGFIKYSTSQQAKTALNRINNSAFQGRIIHATFAQRLPDLTATVDPSTVNRLTAFQEQRRKDEKNRGVTNWNSAFVRSDAAAMAASQSLGIENSTLLDTNALSGGSIAVRMAMSETAVLQSNKEYFTSLGLAIDTPQAQQPAQGQASRADRVLLIKNLQLSSEQSIDELESLFTSQGSLLAFLLSPSRTMAIACYLEPSEARRAFKALAYRRFQGAPIYLEWPLLQSEFSNDDLEARINSLSGNHSHSHTHHTHLTTKPTGALQVPVQEEEDNGRTFATLFIKNLSFATNEDTLRAHITALRAADGLRTVIIRKKAGKGDIMLSQGFGFAEYKDQITASKAMKIIHNSILDSHSLEVKPSEQRITSTPTNNTRVKGLQRPRLVVRNIAFQAAKAEIRELFQAYGAVQAVRLPKSSANKPRGFAFVDFATLNEAETAKNALVNVHLYGRRLVLEWAQAGDEDDVGGGGSTAHDDTAAAGSGSRKRALKDGAALALASQRQSLKRVKREADDGMDEGGLGSGDISMIA